MQLIARFLALLLLPLWFLGVLLGALWNPIRDGILKGFGLVNVLLGMAFHPQGIGTGEPLVEAPVGDMRCGICGLPQPDLYSAARHFGEAHADRRIPKQPITQGDGAIDPPTTGDSSRGEAP